MSIETANAARFKKGLMKLTPLEGELLEALENCKGFLDHPVMRRRHRDDNFYAEMVVELRLAMSNANGSSPDCEDP